MLNLPKLFFVAVMTFVISGWAVAPAAGLQDKNGQEGADGVAGDPATDGTDGEDGEGDFNHVPGWQVFNIVRSQGGLGGQGGDGGPGEDGDDPDTSADGGNAGDGGDGGFATASWNARVRVEDYGPRYRVARSSADGGDGGDGGMPGVGENGGADGNGGNGGNGGFAFSIVSGEQQVYSYARGGNGGVGYGFGRQGGDGASAAVNGFVISHNPDDVREHSLELRQFGGWGGKGLAGANGGNGGSLIFGNANSGLGFFTVAEDQEIDFRSAAGGGGHSEDGNGGKGGNNQFNWDAVAPGIANQTDGDRKFEFEIFGGAGGNGTATVAGNAAGGNAGWAALKSQSGWAITDQIYQLGFDLRGGRGGNSYGELNTANGADGGLVVFDKFTIRDQRPNSTPHSSEWGIGFLTLDLEGGHGGSALGSGNGGHGASVNLANKLEFDTWVTSTHVLAEGGQGGFGTLGGDGGDASIVLNRAVANPNLTGDRFFLASIGGAAGQSRPTTSEFALGGKAYTELYQASNSHITANLSATGGMAIGGRSGDATAKGTVISFGADHSAIVRSYARGSSNEIRSEDKPKYGLSSNAQATAIGNGSRDAFARSHAWATYGTIESGSAFSFATAINHADGGATSESESIAYADRLAGTANNAKSVAVSSSTTGQSNAKSKSSVWGHFSIAQARSHIRDTGGSATSTAITRTVARPVTGEVSTTLDYSGAQPYSEISTSAQIAYRQSDLGEADGFESVAHAILDPHPVGVREFVSGHLNIQDTFVNGDNAYYSNVVGLGRFHAGYSDTALGDDFSVSSSLDVTMELDDRIHTDESMLFGLFDPNFTGNGFDSLDFELLYDGELVIDESFTDVNDAVAFFGQNIFELEYLPDSDDLTKSFQINYSMATTAEMDSFGFKFIFGDGTIGDQANQFFSMSSVPEPGSCVILMVCGLMLGRRRRKELH